ncbi:hypothetical protein NQ317_011260, partial [Molorchus minor]
RIPSEKLNIPNHLPLADPGFSLPGEINILLGADCHYELLTQGLIKLGKNMLVLQNTHLGWVVAGRVHSSNSLSDHYSTSIHLSYEPQEHHNLDSLLTKFWNIEEIPQKSPSSLEEEYAENIFVSTSTILQNGSFQVDLPLKTPSENLKLGDSFSIAKKRFFYPRKALYKRLKIILCVQAIHR